MKRSTVFIFAMLVAGCHHDGIGLPVGDVCSTEGQRICSNAQYIDCKSGNWSEPKVCPDGVLCTDDETDCDWKQTCSEAGKKVCKNGSDGIGNLSVCRSDLKEETSSCGSASCNAEGDDCGVCRNGSRVCRDNKVYECEDGHADKEIKTCNAQGCLADGSDCAACMNGDQICEDGRVKTCVDGKYGEWTSCPNQMSCRSDGMGCSECIEGDVACADDHSTKSCRGGRWEPPIACDDASTCSGGRCASECKDGMVRCQNREDGVGVMQSCQKGVWRLDNVCSKQRSCNSAGDGCADSSAACQENATRCENNADGVGMMQKCAGGQWTLLNVCEDGNACQDDRSCAQACRDGAMKCAPDADGKGIIMKCSGGSWGQWDRCPGNMPCADGLTCAEPVTAKCSEGATRCEYNPYLSKYERQTCFGGDWSSDMPCDNGCNASKTDCAAGTPAVCTHGQSRCEYSTYLGMYEMQTCNMGQWASDMSCPNGCNASGTGCASAPAACTHGQSRCEYSPYLGMYEMQTCNMGQWASDMSCPNGCNASGTGCASAPASCTYGQTRCEYNPYLGKYEQQTCFGGEWASDMPCNNGCNAMGTGCASGGSSGGCTPGATRCEYNPYIGKYELQSCFGGEWGSDMPCNYGCNASGTGCK